MNKHIAIAIDGPSGAGKSTVARRVAADFGFKYVDTGAIYRTVGYAAQLKGLDSRDEAGVSAMLRDIDVDFCYDGGGEQHMLLDGRDVSKEIRTPKSSIYASDVSAMPEVRAFLLDMQRRAAEKYDVIMDGRDIGTVVLPDAGLKIFLTASAQVRAERRCRELEQKGMPTPFDEVLRDIKYRDEQDSSRDAAPLKKAPDAVELDTSDMDFETSIELVGRMIRERFSL